MILVLFFTRTDDQRFAGHAYRAIALAAWRHLVSIHLDIVVVVEQAVMVEIPRWSFIQAAAGIGDQFHQPRQTAVIARLKRRDDGGKDQASTIQDRCINDTLPRIFFIWINEVKIPAHIIGCSRSGYPPIDTVVCGLSDIVSRTAVVLIVEFGDDLLLQQIACCTGKAESAIVLVPDTVHGLDLGAGGVVVTNREILTCTEVNHIAVAA